MSILPVVNQPLPDERIQGSAREVIRIARKLLAELRTQNDLIQKRIHVLKKVVTGLNALQVARSLDSPHHKVSGYPSNRKIAKNLRRACRIALMEADGAEDVEQLINRIKRRGSYEFPSPADPTELVSRQLRLMLSRGEVSHHPAERGSVWQLVNIARLSKTSDDPDRPASTHTLPLHP